MLLHSRRRFRIRLTPSIAILLCLTVFASANPILITFAANGMWQKPKESDNGKARKVKPAPPDKGKPKLTLPNLDEIRARRENHPEIKPAIESLVRSKRKPLQKWDGRKFGDPGTTGARPQARGERGNRSSSSDARAVAETKFNHSRRSAAAPPPLPDDNFVASFVDNAMGRGIDGPEQVYWDDVLRSAYYQGPDAVFTAAREMGRTIFQSKEYYERSRSNRDYVYDLYKTYLMRDPSNPYDSGWDFWTSTCDAYGREAVRAAFDACGDFYNLATSLTPNGAITGGLGSISSARVDPFNQSGDQITARDAEWSLPLISLPGRAGLDLGLGLSYSSLVWTKSGPYLYFDEDISQISPGFHLGFASIQGPFFDGLTHKKVYMLVSSSGSRVELRQVGDGAYEAADSSHLQLIEGGHSLAQEVNWTNVSGVAVNGSTLAATYGYWAAGASSTQTIASGDGYVEATIAETNTYRMIGLGNTDSNQSYTDIDFAWYPIADGTLQIYESGAYVGSFGTYAIGDGLRVAVEGGQVKYRKNGQLLYTSTHAPTYPLSVDTSFYNPGSTLNNVVIGNGGVTAPSGTLLLCASDGSRILYSSYASDWQATQVKDRNGNYLTIDNDWRGDIHTITDTLGRVIYFNNDGNGNLSSITQYTAGGWHTWATFGWGAPQSMSVWNMSGVVGTYHGESVPVLRQVNLMDGSYFTFEYTGAGQVNIIRRYASDNTQQSYVVYDYDGATTDCPRLNQTRVWANGWSGSPGVPWEITTQFDVVGGGGHRMITPDATSYIQYYGNGWQNGLVIDARVYAPGLQRQTTTAYTQDNPGVNYQTNPRVAETNVHDAVGNRKRTTIDYTGSFGLPGQIAEYNANASSILRYTRFEYVDDSYYTSRRIISLPSRQTVYNGSGGVEARTTYGYDAGSINPQAQYAVQHDAGYDTNYYARGNATELFRWDASDPDNQSKRLTTEMTYDAAGNRLTAADPASHTTSLNYSDSFSDSTFHNAYAYPGMLTDADGHSSYVQYNYDFGDKTRTESPAPAGQSVGAIQSFYYDGARRLYEIYNGNLASATYFGYGPNYSQTWASVNSQSDNYSFRYFDGLGRENASLSYHPSTNTYGTQLTYYDVMGRVSQQSNPTEMYGNWSPSADEAGGWIYAYQTYDWKGRPLVTTNQDGTQKYASYSGCGCAGGEVVTITDEVGRQQRMYSDVLGRQVKIEVLNWDNSVYSATVSSLNARDQAYLLRQFQGPEGGGTYTEISATYDGYGRMATKKLPEQTNPTVYAYNNDDTVQSVTDPRGVVASNTYNARHLLTGVSFTSNPSYSPVAFGYDAAGNRTSMTDGTGSTSFGYDQLSRATSESHYISDLGTSYNLGYGYNLIGEMTSITDHWGAQVSYNYDANGRLANMPASGYTGVSNFLSNAQYRAFGAMKQATYGNSVQLNVSYNSRMQIGQYQIGSSYFTTGASMSYYNDGRTNTAFDLSDGRFDRKYEFDFAARLKEAYSGAEAHGAPAPPFNQANSPYRQSFTYDPWNNVTLRTGRIWSTQAEYDSGSYGSDNKRAGFGYDWSGNVTSDSGGGRTYDAAGRPCAFSSWQNWQVYPNWPTNHPNGPALETTDLFDGAGQVVKHTERVRTDFSTQAGDGYISYYMTDITTATYYVHSAVLGGKTIAELNQSGAKSKGYVYSANGRIATQTFWTGGSSVELESTNPVTGASTTPDVNGTYAGRREPDPLSRDLTSPPDPFVVQDPLSVGAPGGDRVMPIEASWGPSQEFLNNNQAWANEMDLMQLRDATSGPTPKKALIHLILEQNPNIGVTTNGGRTLYGSDAANSLIDFVRALNSTETEGEREELGGVEVSGQAIGERIGNAQDDADDLLKSGTKEARSRLNNETCGKFFGGTQKGIEALNNMSFSTDYSMPESGHPQAQVTGTSVQVNPHRGKNGDGGGLITPDGEKHPYILINPDKANEITVVTLEGVVARAFGQLHETAHPAKRFGKTDNDLKDVLNGYRNNYKIWKACFSEAKPEPWNGKPPLIYN